MIDPLSLVPLAVAARAGRLNGFQANQTVAAGVALLQRCAPLVRALQGRRSGILLSTSGQVFTALAASDGRAAVLLPADGSAETIAQQLAEQDVGAVFTTQSLERLLPPSLPRVRLDDAPRSATFATLGDTRTIDLVLHAGLGVEGEEDAPGAAEPCVVLPPSSARGGRVRTHQQLLAAARATIAALSLRPTDHALMALPWTDPGGLIDGALAPLLAGGRVTCAERQDVQRCIQLLETGDVTLVAAGPDAYQAWLDGLPAHGDRVGTLRVALAGATPIPPALADRWYRRTSVPIEPAPSSDEPIDPPPPG